MPSLPAPCNHFFVLVSILIVLCDAQITGNWIQHKQQPPPRSKHGQIKIANDLIFFFGGRTPGGDSLRDAWTFNTTSQLFKEVKLLGEPPGPRLSMSAAAVYNSRAYNGFPMVYIWAGLATERPTVDYDMYEIDPNTWMSNKIDSKTLGRYRQSTVVMGTQILVIFGVAQGMKNDVWSFNTEDYTWSVIAPLSATLPKKRFSACCNMINATAFACFGGTHIDVTDSNDIHMFDTVFRRWQVAPVVTTSSRPAKRRICACFYDPVKNVYSISHGWSGAELVGYNDTWEYNFATASWQDATPLQTITGYNEKLDSSYWTIMPSRKAYLFGGWGEVTTLNSLWEYDMDTRAMTMIFVNQEKPSARFSHCVVNVGNIVIVLLGATDTSVLSDVWSYDTTTNTWARVDVDGFNQPLYGASCQVIGTKILIFGGKKSLDGTSDYSGDMYYIDTTAHKGGIVSLASGDRPDARYLHASTVWNGAYVIMGGKNQGTDPLQDLWVFQTELFKWRQAIQHPGPGKRHKFILLSMSQNRMLFMDGDDGVTNLNDRWVATPTFVPSKTKPLEFDLEIDFNGIENVTNNDGLILADVVRTSANGIVGYNASRAFILGGSMDADSIVERSAFHMFDLNTNTNNLLPPMVLPVMEAPVVFLGKSLYVFGGRRLAEGVVLEHVAIMQQFIFDDASICRDFDDTSRVCVPCPFGFEPPNCTPCPINTFFDVNLGKCVRCASGRVNTMQGITYRSGCSLDSNSESSVNASESATSSKQPDPYVQGAVPMDVWIAVAVIGGVSLLFIVFLVFGTKKFNDVRRNKFLTPEMADAIQRIFVDCAGSEDDGIEDRGVFMLLQALVTQKCRHIVTEGLATRLVSQFDNDGTRLIELDEFTDMVVECCLSPKLKFDVDWERLGVDLKTVPKAMRALPDDPKEQEDILAQKSAAQNKFIPDLKGMDLFYDGHTVGLVGEPMCIKKTHTGGIATIAWILGVLVIMIALIGEEVYANEIEERTTQPYLTLPFTITGDVSVKISLAGSGFDSSIDRDLQTACNNVDVKTQEITNYGQISRSCEIGVGVFNFTWTCIKCNMGSSSATVTVASFDDRAYATYITGIITTSTGIKYPRQSSVQTSTTSRIVYPKSGNVFRGLGSPSVFRAQAFPTVFGRKDDVDNHDFNATRTGYHVFVTSTDKGDQIEYTQFQNVNGIRVDFVFSVEGSSTLMITQREVKTVPTFLSGLVGALSGFVGLCVAVMKFFDGRGVKARQEIIDRKEKEEEEKEHTKTDMGETFRVDQSNTKESLIPPEAPLWYHSAVEIMGTGLSYQTSRAIIAAILTLDKDIPWPGKERPKSFSAPPPPPPPAVAPPPATPQRDSSSLSPCAHPMVRPMSPDDGMDVLEPEKPEQTFSSLPNAPLSRVDTEPFGKA
eukprot:PhF_6_TR26708/c1_g1_i2/m.39036